MLRRFIWGCLLPRCLSISFLRSMLLRVYARHLRKVILSSLAEHQRISEDKSLDKYPVLKGLMLFTSLLPAAAVYYCLDIPIKEDKC